MRRATSLTGKINKNSPEIPSKNLKFYSKDRKSGKQLLIRKIWKKIKILNLVKKLAKILEECSQCNKPEVHNIILMIDQSGKTTTRWITS